MANGRKITRRKFVSGAAFAAASLGLDQSVKAAPSPEPDGLEIRTAASVVFQYAQEPVPLMVYNGSATGRAGVLTFSCTGGSVLTGPVHYDLEPKGWKMVVAHVQIDPRSEQAIMTCLAGGASAKVVIHRGFDLTELHWKWKQAPVVSPVAADLASPNLDDRNWASLQIPQEWNSNDNAWCRTWITIPEQWRGQPLHLFLGGVDDNDITYWNGLEIGRTNGWNTNRRYSIPSSQIRWGQPNLLTIMVENPTYGGGLYEPPYVLYAGNSQWVPGPSLPLPKTGDRPIPGRIGSPYPLRPIHVDHGVLRYPEGAEVALWGVNYYPMAWNEFVNMEKRQVDMKAVIREDLTHLQEMEVEAIRIHVFDREISDGAGSLRPNIHLDLLDYLVSECSKRGIYFYFTLIAWWASPNELPGAFSTQSSKPGMMFAPAAKAAAVNFIRQFLQHVNRYSGRMLKDEPSVCFLEVMNEPDYFVYGDIHGSSYTPQGEPNAVLDHDHRIFRELWSEWLGRHKLKDTPVYFPFFRYELMRSYIRQMIDAIRSTGASQPVAISYFFDPGDDITQAIADSECEAVTVSIYPGGWGQVNDGINLLPSVGKLQLDQRLAGKARVAYEFDAPATNVSCYLYPAIAAHFRSGECQIACQFQYDTIATARWNTDWNAHWLNFLYTPTKAVSYMAAGEAFRRLQRGVTFTSGTDQLVIGPMATSFYHNMSMAVTPEAVFHSRQIPGNWRPLPLPNLPARIVGTGSSPYADYGGSGLYKLEKINERTFHLLINPDASLVGNCLQGSFTAPVGELQERLQWFHLNLPGWEKAKCSRIEGKRKRQISIVEGGWLLRPGRYHIEL